MTYSRPTRWLHLALSAGISAQLLLSTVMEQPRPGRTRSAFELLTFGLHEKIGVALFGVLFVQWLILLLGKAHRGMGHFFPWLSAERRRLIHAEIAELARFRLPDPETHDALAGSVQGIGIVVGSLLALTGSVMFFGMNPDGSMSAAMRSIREVHQTLGPVMWGYLVVHGGAVLAHVAFGRRSLLAIFRP